MKIGKKNIVFLAPVMVIVITLICSCTIYIVLSNDYRNREKIDAVITDVQTVGKGRNSDKTTYVYYSYTVDGIVYSGLDSFSGDSTGFRISDKIEVWYKPDNPQKSSSTVRPTTLDIFAPFFLGVPLALGVWGFYNDFFRWNYRTPTRAQSTGGMHFH